MYLLIDVVLRQISTLSEDSGPVVYGNWVIFTEIYWLKTRKSINNLLENVKTCHNRTTSLVTF